MTGGTIDSGSSEDRSPVLPDPKSDLARAIMNDPMNMEFLGPWTRDSGTPLQKAIAADPSNLEFVSLCSESEP